MICPYCKEEIADGAIKCKHCSSRIEDVIKLPNNFTTENDEEIINRIKSLDLSKKLKEKLLFVHENLQDGKSGYIKYRKGTPIMKTYSFWALLFTYLYYLVKGMWKKAISLTILSFALATLPSLIGLPGELGPALVIFVSVIAMQSAYYDLYRKEVLKESFWW